MLVDGGSFTSIVLMFGYRLGDNFGCLHIALPMRTVHFMLLTRGGLQLCP
jgi:hypothetical protein